ncbi:MAG: Sec-independent protein translocase protein TatB [Gammaproteobacteria bacterium]|nr:Sec-independent protein translocase protein TatB [Gammaproteobacteria bacterium]
MFDIGFMELLLVSVVGLLVLGPERLPGAIRTASLWMGRLRSSFNKIRSEIEREINVEEIKREIHNDAVMRSLKEAEQDLRDGLSNTPYDIDDIVDDKPTEKSTGSDEK